MKGQFMIISAVIAGLIVITLSSTISDIQSQTFSTQDLPQHINQLRDEAKRITADGDISEEEKRNFRKMTGYVSDYRVDTVFNDTANCVEITIESTSKRAELPCVN